MKTSPFRKQKSTAEANSMCPVPNKEPCSHFILLRLYSYRHRSVAVIQLLTEMLTIYIKEGWLSSHRSYALTTSLKTICFLSFLRLHAPVPLSHLPVTPDAEFFLCIFCCPAADTFIAHPHIDFSRSHVTPGKQLLDQIRRLLRF